MMNISLEFLYISKKMFFFKKRPETLLRGIQARDRAHTYMYIRNEQYNM